MKIPFPFVFSWNLINIAVHKLVDTAVNICNDFPGITVPLQNKDKLIKTAKRMEREDAMGHSVEENYYWKPSVYLQKTTPETKLSPQVFVWPVSRLVEISSSPLSELKLPFFYNQWRELNAVRKKLNEGEQISIFVPRCLWLCPPKNSKVQFSQWEALLSFLLAPWLNNDFRVTTRPLRKKNHNQLCFPWNLPKAREKPRVQGATGFGLQSPWLKNWRVF